MTSRTIAQSTPATASGPAPATASGPGAPTAEGRRIPSSPPTVAQSRAARELGLARIDFDLAVQLGRIRTVPDGSGGHRRVAQAELDRVRSAAGFPHTLRESVKAVGTKEGAELLGITSARFTKLARLGLLRPVKFYLNRYRAVVWLYLAEDLHEFAAKGDSHTLLTGRTPEHFRSQLDTGTDLRARNWRFRYLGSLLRQTEDPWERAAVTASLLPSDRITETVRDPGERARLTRLGPPRLSKGNPNAPTAQIVERIMTADDEDEIAWLQVSLGLCLAEARQKDAEQVPTGTGHTAPGMAVAVTSTAVGAVACPEASTPATGDPKPTRTLLKWLRRRGA
ncbi:DUF6397 family protein [Streptomyces sp. NPDC091292]|uniref:DUF6397 family protein n=1 Tax=Streptomyces sp. NPDC091292 TaxID=3365991 RepID=UPI00380199B5